MENIIFSKFYLIILLIPILVLHELAHGLTAYWLGDKTAKHDGRLTLNPLRHIDWIGMLMLIMIGFGWAKPVMVNPNNLRRPRRDMAIIALAGPVTNFLLTFVFTFIGVALVQTGNNQIGAFTLTTAQLSLALGLFNLIPVPPLDGSKVIGGLVPYRFDSVMGAKEQAFMSILLMVLIFTGAVSTVLTPIVSAVMNVIMDLALMML